jgi:CRISPR/Cas system type I-B associated protein Csh2 (Cas7 group RAMP superfamily)
MKSLYNLESEYLRIAEALTEGEVTEELEQALQINQSELQAKGLAYGHMIKSLEYDVDIIDVEIARLEAIRNSRKNALDRLKTNLKGAMELYGIVELKSPTMKVSFRKSESVVVNDLSQLEERFVKTQVSKTADKVAIKQAIKDGEDVQGAELVINQSLQIK